MSYLPSYTVNVQNWHSIHRGKIIAILQIPYQFGAILISITYNSFFAKGHEEEVMLQDLHGFFLAMSVFLGCLSLLSMILTGEYPYNTEIEKDQERLSLVERCATRALNSQITSEQLKYNHFLRGMVQLDSQLIFWTLALTPVAGLILGTNITAMLKSLGHIKLSFAYTTAGPFCVLCVVFIVSYISDKYRNNISRVSISMLVSAASTLVLLLSIAYGHYLSIITIAYFISIASTASAFCLLPTVLTEKFDDSLFGYVYPFSCLVPNVMNALVQYLVGYMYEKQAHDGECWGAHCFHHVMILTCCVQLLGTILHSLSISHAHFGGVKRNNT